jgi:hypothetical protein
MMLYESDLRINQRSLPPFSARNCQQQITTFNPGGLRQTINGKWVAVHPDQPPKYQTTIIGQDFSAPALHHLCPGESITLYSIQPFIQPLQLHQTSLLRPPVEGSLKVYSASYPAINFSFVAPQIICTDVSPQENAFVQYRPILQMTVLSFKMDFKEWGEHNQWTLVATE